MGFSRKLLLTLFRHARIPAIAAGALAMPLNAAHAGFFDFLFGPPPVAQSPAPGYPGAIAPRLRGDHFRQRKNKAVLLHHPKNVTMLEKAGKPRKGLPHASPAGLMDDDSLKDGDAVMTQRGIRIFTGDSGRHHKPEDFARLSEIKGLSGRTRTALAAIDANRSDAGKRIERQHEVVTGRSAAEPHVAAGTMITDAKGRQIRYVGP